MGTNPDKFGHSGVPNLQFGNISTPECRTCSLAISQLRSAKLAVWQYLNSGVPNLQFGNISIPECQTCSLAISQLRSAKLAVWQYLNSGVPNLQFGDISNARKNTALLPNCKFGTPDDTSAKLQVWHSGWHFCQTASLALRNGTFAKLSVWHSGSHFCQTASLALRMALLPNFPFGTPDEVANSVRQNFKHTDTFFSEQFNDKNNTSVCSSSCPYTVQPSGRCHQA
ncbi:Uncharacterized protein dnm_065680 [Desulfonema magnum]|uniref:Uncharacterized protein n=1 Tax=Desulfonema magnum TaxID=45655 RepID=A0A975GR35_9BACT|nr:Uncharacterized protein dnm_065680 [Desulfonema magnum]